MTYLPRFAEPIMLLWLIAIPLCIYLGTRIRTLSTLRKWGAVTLRTIILLSLIFALAGMEIVKLNDQLAVFFLLDQSNSVPEDLRTASTQWVRDMTGAYMTEKDAAGVIVFGDEASIEHGVKPASTGVAAGEGMGAIRSFVGGDQSDMAAAIRLAMAAFPQGYMRRIVVFSDGNETRGSALEEVRLANAEGIALDVVPLQTQSGSEIRVREVAAPSQVDADEPFQLRVVVEASQAGSAELRIFQRAGTERRMLLPQQVQLQPGDNVFLLTQELAAAGFYEYEVQIEGAADTLSANNTGQAFTTVQGEPQVLYVARAADTEQHLQQALLDEGINLRVIDPFSLPSSPAQLQSFDAVLLSDVAATDLSTQQLGLLEAAVRDQGIGLVMVGGPESFGAGGYLNSPVERALPVDMDIKQRKILPRGALVTILHTCEFPDGNSWARKIALAALDALSAQDLMGGLGYFHSTGDSWMFNLQPVGDKTQLRKIITMGTSNIGDMPATEPCLRLAYNALVNADAAVKRVIIISDGDPGAPTSGLLNQLAAAGIAVSTICINPHSPSDQGMLQSVARITGGQYYFVTNPNNLPQIFTKEASIVKRGLLIEKEFYPALNHQSELLYGTGEGMPPLHGYVVTTAKENATVPLVSDEGDPILAHWRFGLGKSVAFTSDATTRWGTAWVPWEGYQPFWAQAVRWSLREITPTNFRVETRQSDGRGHIKIDAVDEAGNFLNFLRPKGTVTLPDLSSREVDLVQTAPGIYEGDFPAEDQGVYMMTLSYEDENGETGLIPAGLAVGYSKEYEYNSPNIPLLEQLASVGGGSVAGPGHNPFEHDLEASATVTPIWPWLVALAACLLPFEIFLRRVVLPWQRMLDGVRVGMRKLPGMGRLVAAPPERAAPVTGAYRAARGHDYSESAPDEAVSFGEISAPPPEAPLAAAPEAKPDTNRPAAQAGHSDYTSRLLAAKERALKGKKKEEHDE